MGPSAAVKSCFRKYATFSGRASRSEFWWFLLFAEICAGVQMILLTALGEFSANRISDGTSARDVCAEVLYSVVVLGVFPPMISATVRRAHDRDCPGKWCLIYFVPFGSIWLLVSFCRRGTAGDNRFGPDPLAESR